MHSTARHFVICIIYYTCDALNYLDQLNKNTRKMLFANLAQSIGFAPLLLLLLPTTWNANK